MKLAILLFYISVGISSDLPLAKMLIVQEQYVDALQLLDNNMDARARYYAGWCHMKLGNCDNATAEFSAFIQSYDGYGAVTWKAEAAANITACSGTVVIISTSNTEASIRVWTPEDYINIKKDEAPVKIWSATDATIKPINAINIWTDEVNPREIANDVPVKIYNATEASTRPGYATNIWPDQDVNNANKTFSTTEILELKNEIDQKIKQLTNKGEKGKNDPMTEHVAVPADSDQTQKTNKDEKGKNDPMTEHVEVPTDSNQTQKTNKDEKGKNDPMTEHVAPPVDQDQMENANKGDNDVVDIPSGNSKNYYKILFSIENTPNKTFLSLSNLGPVTYDEANGGAYYLYYVGYYNTKLKAENALASVKNAGYQNAQINEFNPVTKQGKPLPQKEKPKQVTVVTEPNKSKETVKPIIKNTEPPKVAQEPEPTITEVIKSEVISYHILFRILDNPYQKFDDLAPIGPLYRETFDKEGNSRYLIGNTDEIEEAKKLLIKVKEAGYRASFIAEYINGSLNKILQE